jgi:multidrug efflux system membrane fusion protein
MKNKAKKNQNLFIKLTLVAVILFAAIFGYNHYVENSNQANAQPENGQQNSAMPVEVKKIQKEKIRIWSQFSGRIAAVEIVEVMPRVLGEITEIHFEEGSLVEKGDLLYIIDPRPFEAEMANAEADLKSAKSEAKFAKLELERAKKLVEKEFVSISRVDNLQNEYDIALANISAAEARLRQAELNLEFAYIKAPVSGKISRAEITVGNLVQNQLAPPVLTTIVSNDRVYAEFDVDEKTYINNIRGTKDLSEIPVKLTLSTDDSVVYTGNIHAFDNKLDVNSGTIRARAILENKDGVLIPGMFANIELGSPNKQEVILVDEKIVGTDQSKKYVYVVNNSDEVEYREVTLGKSMAGKRIIKTGLKEGDVVITNNLVKIRPGTKVSPNYNSSDDTKVSRLDEDNAG